MATKLSQEKWGNPYILLGSIIPYIIFVNIVHNQFFSIAQLENCYFGVGGFSNVQRFVLES